MNIQQGQFWRYIGPGEGRGLAHLVTGFVDGDVCTISEFTNHWFGAGAHGGYMWAGPIKQFGKEFEPIAGASAKAA